jgi:transcriptional regulator GlxA family with amidase domain
MSNDTAKLSRVAIVTYDGLSIFEFAVACDIFGLDRSEEYGVPWYRLSVCAARSGQIAFDGGFSFFAPHGLRPLRSADTVIVPPTEHPERVPDEVLVALRAAHRQGARIVSLCSGAIVLAATGLLDGRRAATHWADAEKLARQFPDVTVDSQVLYIDDGDILTSAGSAASIDLCLHLVRQDHGAEIAARLARELVVPLYRDGGQAQYIATPMPVAETTNLMADAMAWMREHLDESVTIDDLARRSAMSRRTFARRFLDTTGTTPYRWLLLQRIQLAQQLLETTDMSIDLVAEQSGFATPANLRKHFAAFVRISPQAYRRAFRSRMAEGSTPAVISLG